MPSVVFSRRLVKLSRKRYLKPEATPEPVNEPEPEAKQRGRPRGKKSDPEFVSAIAYIRKKTHLQVKRLLLDKEELGDKQDFSELVQDLLDFWVEIPARRKSR
jgi:hypothetical protein